MGVGGWVLEGDDLWGSEDNVVELFPFLFYLYMDPWDHIKASAASVLPTESTTRPHV